MVRTSGTTFFHHGSEDRSSANQVAVAEPTSFFRLDISVPKTYLSGVKIHGRMPKLTLKVDTSFWVVLSQILQWWPSILIPRSSSCALDGHAVFGSAPIPTAMIVLLEYLRHVVSSSPRRSILDVIITWHMLCCHRDLVVGIL